MIQFSLRSKSLRYKQVDFHNYFVLEKAISKNKSILIQVYKSSIYYYFELEVDLAWTGQDHAGPGIQASIGKYGIYFKLYDNRHWDNTLGKWEESSNV